MDEFYEDDEADFGDGEPDDDSECHICGEPAQGKRSFVGFVCEDHAPLWMF